MENEKNDARGPTGRIETEEFWRSPWYMNNYSYTRLGRISRAEAIVGEALRLGGGQSPTMSPSPPRLCGLTGLVVVAVEDLVGDGGGGEWGGRLMIEAGGCIPYELHSIVPCVCTN